MTSPQRPYEILIAEDNNGDMLLVREALDAQGIPCNLQIASDGEAAIALIERFDHEPLPLLDLLIVDMHLPKYDGVEILRKLRSTARLKTTPAIVLSGSPAERIHSQTMQYGPVYPFNKPADLNGFMALGRLADGLLKTEMRAEAEMSAPKSNGTTI